MTTNKKYEGWLHSGFFSGLQKLSVPLSSVLITMVLAHKALTKEEMGVWALFMTITSVIEIIRQSLVKSALVKFINFCTEEEQPLVIGAAFFLNTFITILTALVMLVLTPYIADRLEAPQLVNMLYILQVGMLLMIPFSHFEWLMYGKTLFKGLFWTYFFRQGITLILVLSVFLVNEKVSLNTLAIIYNIAMFIGVLVSYRTVKPLLKNAFVFSKEWIIKMGNFGKYVFASGLSTLLFRSADQFLLSPILKTTAFNGSQSIAMRFINLSDLPSQTLGDILFPKSARSESSSKPSVIKYYYEKTVGASLCVVLPLVLVVMIFPEAIIYVLAGPEYYDAVPYLRLIAVSSITLAYLKQYGVIMDSTGRPMINTATTGIIALVNLGLLYFLINRYQLLGAGYALVISHIVGFIITQSLLYKFFRINFLNAIKYAFAFYPEFISLIWQRLPWKIR